MAKQKLSRDGFDLNDDLDFNDFGLGDIDDGSDPLGKERKDRKPVTDAFKGTISGAKNKFKDPSFLASSLEKALPKQYGEIFTAMDRHSSSLSSLYDETIREVKPQLSRLAKKVDKLIPEERKFFKKMTEHFVKLAGEEYSAYKGPSREQQEDSGVASAIASVFEAQRTVDGEIKAKESSESKIKDQIQNNRYQANYGLLSSISEGVTRLSTYNDRVNQAYQKKSLELQFRSYFVQSELLRTTSEYFQTFKHQNEAIKINTSLPEFVKIKDSERFKELAKGKFINTIQSSLFGDGDVIKIAVDRLKQQAKQALTGFKQGTEAALMGLEGMDDISGALEGAEMSKFELAGREAGSTVAGWLGDKLSKRVRGGIDDSSKIGKTGYRLAEAMNNPAGAIRNLKSSKFMRENSYTGGIKGTAANVANWGLDLFAPSKPDMNVPGSMDKLGDPTIFNSKTNTSITEIIPGYLSMIHRELAAMRTNDDTAPAKVFDFKTSKFVTTQTMKGKVDALFKSKVSKGGYKQTLDRNASFFSSEDNPLSDLQQDAIRNFLIQLSFTDTDLKPESIFETDAYKQSPVKKLIKNKLKTGITDADNPDKAQLGFTKGIKSLRDTTPDIRGEIETFIKEGHAGILEEANLITMREDGSYDVNVDRYMSLLGSKVVASDVNIKRQIKSYKPKDALAAIKKTQVYNWFYKSSKGDQEPHTGPMAQDVNANMGEEAAPDGTKIDLTTMNGMNMAAITALHETQQQSLKSPGSTSVLKAILSNTDAMLEIMKSGNSTSSKSESIVNSGLKLGTSLYNVASGAIDITSKSIKPVIEFLTSSIKDPKSTIKDTFSKMFTAAGDMASKTMTVVTDVIYNKLPKGYTQLAGLAGKAKNWLVDQLSRPIDIFVKGNPIARIEANLLKAGYYIDQTTGTVIKSIADIKGPVVNRMNEVVLTAKDITQGLVDVEGKEVITPFAKVVKAIAGSVFKGITRIKDFYKNIQMPDGGSLVSKLFGGSSADSGMGSDRIYDVLVEIRDSLGNKLASTDTSNETTDSPSVSTNTDPKYRSSGGIFNKAVDVLSSKSGKKRGVFSTIRGMAGKLLASNTNEDTDTAVSPDVPEAKPNTIRSMANKVKTTWNDRDGSGKRDGDWRDRLDAIKNKAIDHSFKKADTTAKYRSSENIIDTMIKKAGSIFGMMEGGVTGMFGKVGGLLETAGSMFGLKGLGKITGMFKSALGIVKNPKGALTAGKALLTASKAGTVAKVVGAAKNVKNLMLVGSLLTGGLGSTVAGAIGVGMSAIGAVLSTPVVIGAVAAAAIAYGGYKAYKYLTRDHVNEYEAIRMQQYGLTNASVDSHHNHELLQLEEYLLDGCIGYDKGRTYILQDRIKPEELFGIVSIDAKDHDMTTKFTQWFNGRFKPFLLTHLSALYSINNKAKLSDIHKLSTVERSKYLGMISYESGPYDVTASPFKDIAYLNNDRRIPLDSIKTLLASVKQLAELKRKVYEGPKITEPKPPKPIITTVPLAVTPPLPKTNIASAKEYLGEESVGVKSAPATASIGISGKTRIAQADGPVRDGLTGMSYIKLQSGVNIESLHPGLLQQFKAMAQEYGETTGKSIVVTSGYRSRQQQEALYKKDPSKAAVPGRSLHEFGLALDANSEDLNALESLGLMRKYGFTRPVGKEPWHVEAAGIQGNIQEVKTNGQLANELISMSANRGGGGEGINPGAEKGRRNTRAALALMDIDYSKVIKSDKDRVTDAIKGTQPTTTASSSSMPSSTVSSNGTISSTSGSSSITNSGPIPSQDPKFARYYKPSNEMVSMSGDSGYGGSINATRTEPAVNSTFDQSAKYSKNQYLPDTDVGPTKAQPKNIEEIKTMISDVAKKTNTDPHLMTSFAAVESSLNPNAGATTSSAKGLFQFTSPTWREQLEDNGRKFNLGPNTSPFNPVANTQLATELLKENTNGIKSVKPKPNVTDLYMAHFLGASGARKFLAANPNTIGAQLMPKSAAANRSIFYANGRALTVGQIYSTLSNRLSKKAKSFGIDMPADTLASTGSTSDAANGGIAGGDLPPAAPDITTSAGSPALTMASNTSTVDSGPGMQIAKPKQSIYQTPATVGTPAPIARDSGPGMSASSTDASSIHMNETLDRSLGVQQQMLTVLQQIAAGGQQMNKPLGPQPVANTTTPSSIPKAVIDLVRKAI